MEDEIVMCYTKNHHVKCDKIVTLCRKISHVMMKKSSHNEGKIGTKCAIEIASLEHLERNDVVEAMICGTKFFQTYKIKTLRVFFGLYNTAQNNPDIQNLKQKNASVFSVLRIWDTKSTCEFFAFLCGGELQS